MYIKSDIIVCGGGTAGAFAAIAAAKEGAEVLLIESLGGLGGSAVAGLVLPLMTIHIDGDPRCSYIDKELTGRLNVYNATARNGHEFDPLILGMVLEQMCMEYGVKILFHSTVCGAETKDGHITAISVATKQGLCRIEGNVFIDCTGDGTLGVIAGAGYDAGAPTTGKNQPMSLRYLVGGVDKERLGQFFDSFGDPYHAFSKHDGLEMYADFTPGLTSGLCPVFHEALNNGDLIEQDLAYWQVFGIPGREDTLAFNNPEFFDYPDATDPFQLTAVQLEGKKAILRQLEFYRKYFPGCEKAYISSIAPMVGVRESRRIHTKYILTAKDLLGQRKFDSCISQGNYPIDIHGAMLEFDEIVTVDPNKPWYEIPYESLVASDLDNLLVAGRCAGADFIAQSAIRIQINCRSMGEAAGIAAAMCIKNVQQPSEINGKDVADRMIALGADFIR